MVVRSRKDQPWDLAAVLNVLEDRVYNTCEINSDHLESYMQEIRYYLSHFRMQLESVHEAKHLRLPPHKAKQLEKMAKTFEEVFGAARANIIRTWIVRAKFGKIRKRDAFGQGISLIANYLKSANVTKPYYWSILLLAHAGAPLQALEIDPEDVSDIPQGFRMGGKRAPRLPASADKVDRKIYQRAHRWSDSDHGMQCLAVFGEPTPPKMPRRT